MVLFFVTLAVSIELTFVDRLGNGGLDEIGYFYVFSKVSGDTLY